MQNQMMIGGGGMNNIMNPPRGSGSNMGSNRNSIVMPSQLGSAQLNSVGDGPIGGGDDIDGVIPPPAHLESGVSTTLMKLASSPSKLLAGISTFFSNEPSGFVGPGSRQSFSAEPDPLREDAIPPPSAGLGRAMGRRPSKKSSDLLDDYEETELEARMRAVAGGGGG